MADFLDKILLEKSTGLRKYLNQTDGVILCRCYPAGGENDFANQGDRIFEVGSQVNFMELQELVDQKFGVSGALIQYIGELDEDVTVDSDFVLKKAIERAIDQSYYANEKEVTLRLLIFCQPSLAGGQTATSFLQ